MSFDVNEYYEKLNGENVILAYKGPISTEMINYTLEEVEARLEESDETGKIRKKIYNVLVESLQNLYHHVDDLPEDLKQAFTDKFGVIVVQKNSDVYRIATGNFIRSNKIKFLKDKIDKINSLSPEELKEMYKFILNHQKLSAKGGGGLGLVDIARKTGNKLEYNFYNYDNNFYFFNLDIFIND